MSFLAVQRLEDHGSVVLQGELAKLVHLLTKIFACLKCVRLNRFLRIECRYHDYAGRAELSCCSDDFTHRRVEFSLYCRVLGENESFETCTNGAYLDIASSESLLNLVHALSQLTSVWLEAYDSEVLHVVEPFVQALAWSNLFLKRKLKLHVLCFRCAGSQCSKRGCCQSKSGSSQYVAFKEVSSVHVYFAFPGVFSVC